MGIQDLQSFLESAQIEGSCVGVDLVRIARNIAQKWAKQAKQSFKKGQNNSGKFSLVVDAECCLDRLYGGFFSDWVCGGQWNRVTRFLEQLVSSLNVANIEIVVFFNGCIEQSRTQEWIQNQLKYRMKINQVLRHLANKGTPPPKVWWTPPSCLKPTLRMVLRNLNIPVIVTMDDHKQEVIAYCREYNCHAILADDAEYIAFDPPRYFSARHLKLTYKGTLESKEYIVYELMKGLELTTEQLCVVAALLGNYLLPENDLICIHKRVANLNCPPKPKELPLSMGASKQQEEVGGQVAEVGLALVTGLAELVKKLYQGGGGGTVVGIGMNSHIGGGDLGEEGVASSALLLCPSQSGSSPQSSLPSANPCSAPGVGISSPSLPIPPPPSMIPVPGGDHIMNSSSPTLDNLASQLFPNQLDALKAQRFKQAVQYYLDGTKQGFLKYRSNEKSINKKFKRGFLRKDDIREQETGLEVTRLASEAVTSELDGLMSLSEVNACLNVSPEIVVDDAHQKESPQQSPTGHQVNGGEVVNGQTLVVSSNSSSGSASPARATASDVNRQKPQKTVRLVIEEDKIILPPVAAEITRTVSERHTKGLMSPYIYQILTHGEIKLPVIMEGETNRELPNIQQFYRPMRQMVYAILFNLHHLTFMAKTNKDKLQDFKIPEIKIKEWVWSRLNQYKRPEIVRAEPLRWGVPTIQRLWFGTTVDDKRRRLRAYLTCMRSDTHLILNPAYVPQHLLVLATVLRYIMSFPKEQVLRKHELDALIATAMDPHLPNSEYNQELQVECVTVRGAEVGALVMAGVEHALLVNDACGAPIPWLMTPPWLYFDGKLLAAHLARASSAKNLLDLCSHRIPQVIKVERMREAILEGLCVQWARPPLLPSLTPMEAARVHSVMPAGMAPIPRNGGGRGGSSLPPGVRGRGVTTGGRLEIAGVVVGNWGPNCRLHPDIMLPPQVTSVGGGMNYTVRGGGRPTFSTRGGSTVARGKGRGTCFKFQMAPSKKKVTSNPGKKDSNKKVSKGRGLTVVSPFTGEVVEASTILGYSPETKRILTNSDKKSCQRSSSEPTKVTNPMVNGKPENDVLDLPSLQFEDSCMIKCPKIPSEIILNGEGDGSQMGGVTTIFSATACKEN